MKPRITPSASCATCAGGASRTDHVRAFITRPPVTTDGFLPSAASDSATTLSGVCPGCGVSPATAWNSVSVEPGSPAEKSGLEAGDTIVAYNGADVRNRRISLTRLLTPGTRVTVRVRREGGAKDLPVVVARRPYRFSAMAMPAPDAMVNVEARVTAPDPPSRVRVARAPRAPDAPPMPPAPVIAASPPFYLGGGTAAIAGAELVRMNADLRDVLGVERGLLVITVAQGTPAEQAGLRGGDVIVAVSGEPVSSALDLQRTLRQADERAVTLEVVRKKKTRTLVLRW